MCMCFFPQHTGEQYALFHLIMFISAKRNAVPETDAVIHSHTLYCYPYHYPYLFAPQVCYCHSQLWCIILSLVCQHYHNTIPFSILCINISFLYWHSQLTIPSHIPYTDVSFLCQHCQLTMLFNIECTVVEVSR